MPSLNKHDYSDLLGEKPDRLQKSLINDLDQVARRFDNVQMPVWKQRVVANALRAQMLKQAPVMSRHSKRPVKRLRMAGAIALAALSAVLLMAAALPNFVPVGQLLSWLDSTYGNQRAGKVVNMQQSACGFTMTIKRIYANAAQVFVVYDLQAPKNHSFSHPGEFGVFMDASRDSASLSDNQGHTFPFSLGIPGAQAVDNSNGNDAGQLLSFDVSELNPIPESLSLHLNVPALYTEEVPGSPVTPGCETVEPFFGTGTPEQGTIVHTHFKFGFTVPVESGVQVMHLNKTITSNGTSITLERVVIAPDEGTLIYLKDGYGRIVTNLVVRVNGKEAIPGNEVGSDGGGGENVLEFVRVPHGQWTLTFTSNPSMRTTDKFGRPVAGIKGVQGGPWVFTFKTP